MSETIYTDEEIEILQKKISDNIFTKCLFCNSKNFIVNTKKKPNKWCSCNDTTYCCSCSDTTYCCPNQKENQTSQTNKITFTEDDKLFLIENLKKYKIIGCKIIFKSEYERFQMHKNSNSNSNAEMTLKENIYIHYINIHGDVYANTIIPMVGQYYKVKILDFIDYPFYIYQEHEERRSEYSNRTDLIPKLCLQRRITYDNYNYIYGTLNYIKKSFILPKYILNLILESNYSDYIDIRSMVNYYFQTDVNKKIMIKNLNYTNNIYIKFMKYIINKNDNKYNSLFYHSDDIDSIDSIEILHKKEIDEYYDTIEKEKEIVRLEELDRIAKQQELDRITKEKQDKIDKFQAELDKVTKQEELDKKIIDKQNELDRINQINQEKKDTLNRIQDELNKIAKQDDLDKIIKEKQAELDRISKEKQDRILKEKQEEIVNIARGTITIENNHLIIENNTQNEIDLCEFLPYKNKTICDDSGNIKTIRYTEITHITFINCQFTIISKYFTGITHLILKNCIRFKNLSRYLKNEIKYLQINDEILINVEEKDCEDCEDDEEEEDEDTAIDSD